MDVVSGVKTGGLREKYHYRTPCLPGGSDDDTQRHRLYPLSRLARGPLHRPVVIACVHAEATNVRRPRCYFLRDYLGNPIPSPALFKPMHDRFVAAVDQFVSPHAIPVVNFESGQDKDATATAHRARSTAREGVVMLGIAQQKIPAFKAFNISVGPRRQGPLRVLAPRGRGQSVLLLCPGSRLGSGVREGRHLSAVPVKLCLNVHGGSNSSVANAFS
jgi:hypothetical protein